MNLPTPTSDALQHSLALNQRLQDHCAQQNGWLSFADFMHHALYAPGFGYYAAGAQKFGSTGDFVTAPELSPLFADALARQIAPLMAASAPAIIEVGAGTGRLAADLLLALEALGSLPTQYSILELSPDLQARQAQLIQSKAPHLFARVVWLRQLPTDFSGVVLGNELIDAMPVHLVHWHDAADPSAPIDEIGALWSVAEKAWTWSNRPAAGALLATAQALAQQSLELGEPFPTDFRSEINLAGPAWVASWGQILNRGAVLLIDYGFPAHEFYHPQRDGGTLMCHYRHHAHTDPFYLPGLQDITTHVDFTALIAAGFPAGLSLLGYTSQGQFLLNCGILDCLAKRVDQEAQGDYGTARSVALSAGVNRLVMPHEMGELFKVIALGKGIREPLLGFRQGDRSAQL